MNCFNCKEYLQEALNSIYSQTYKNWEIIFWDNFSNQNIKKILSEYDDRIKYFSSKKNTSLGIARQKALTHSKGKYVAFLDTDDIWLPDKLSKQIQILESNKELGMVFSDSMFFDNTGDKYNYFSVVRPRKGYIACEIIKMGFISTDTLVVRRAAIDKINFSFNPDYEVCMDYDLNIRVALNFKADFVDEVLSKWRIHNNNGSTKLGFKVNHEISEILEDILKNHKIDNQDIIKSIDKRKKINNFYFGLEKWSASRKSTAIKYIMKSNKRITRLFYVFVILVFPFGIYQKGKEITMFLRSKIR